MKNQQKHLQLQDRVGFLISNTSWVIRSHMLKHIHAQGVDVTPEQWIILNWLWNYQSAYQQELADAIQKTKANVTRLIDGLVKRGFVVRELEIADRRKHRCVLTPAGTEMMGRLMPIVLAEYQEVIKDLSGDEIQALKSILAKITHRVQQLSGDKS
ncbi:MAG: MarR family transcriptional regulator [bacterium]|nr:MarR family transcriptional regulator [bacterium]